MFVKFLKRSLDRTAVGGAQGVGDCHQSFPLLERRRELVRLCEYDRVEMGQWVSLKHFKGACVNGKVYERAQFGLCLLAAKPRGKTACDKMHTQTGIR